MQVLDICKEEYKFSILDHFEKSSFNKYDLLNLIEINKITKSKPDIENYFGDSYLLFLKLFQAYKRNLPIFNDELYNLYLKYKNDFNPDCIILPETKNEWLRCGLASLFSEKLNLETHIVKKSDSSVEISNKANLPEDLKFMLDFDVSGIDSVLMLDDLKSSGCTAQLLRKEFKSNVKFFHVFYVKSEAKRDSLYELYESEYLRHITTTSKK